jgi:type VI secretion system protein ImpE
MTPLELFHEARLTEAIEAQREVVALRPADLIERLLLCELLSFTADRDEVRRQFDRLQDVPADVQDYVAEWRALLLADDARHSGRRPEGIGGWTHQHHYRVGAQRGLPDSGVERTFDWLDHADEIVHWVDGHVDGRPFERWRDADDLLGPMLEIFTGDHFGWVDTQFVRKMRLEESPRLRDIVYRPATLWLDQGTTMDVFIPGLYTGTGSHSEDAIRCGFGVDWIDGNGIMRGLGARTFLFDEEELDLNEFRQVELRPWR